MGEITMTENQAKGPTAEPRSPVDAMRGAMQGLHREIGQQHKELLESQGLMNTTMARELNALRTMTTASFIELGRTQEDIIESLRLLHERQHKQGGFMAIMFVTLGLCMLIGFAVVIYGR
jgi:hypothetical protein